MSNSLLALKDQWTGPALNWNTALHINESLIERFEKHWIGLS